MDKREACHRLAEINEAIYDAQNDLERINSRLVWDDPSNRERLLEEKERVGFFFSPSRSLSTTFSILIFFLCYS